MIPAHLAEADAAYIATSIRTSASGIQNPASDIKVPAMMPRMGTSASSSRRESRLAGTAGAKESDSVGVIMSLVERLTPLAIVSPARQSCNPRIAVFAVGPEDIRGGNIEAR